MNRRSIYCSAKLKRLAALFTVAVASLGLASCDDTDGDPGKEIGANPVLPALQQYLLPPIRIAPPAPWGNDTPKVACRKSNPDIFVMQSAEDWATKNTPCPLNSTR